MIRVLHLVHSFQTGGAERVVVALTKHGSSAVSNYVCALCEPSELASQLDGQKTGFKCLGKGEGNDPRVIASLARVIDAERIDVVHAQGWGTFLEGLLAAKWSSRRNPAFIFAFHGKSMDDVAHGIPLRRRIAHRIAQFFTDACVAPAGHMADDYAHTIGMRRDRIDLIYNGIDVEKFDRAQYPAARSALGLGAEDFVVGFVGRLDPVKDVSGVVQIFARVRKGLGKGVERTRLFIVGEGAERENAERTSVALGVREGVVFAGLRTDIPQCMAAMNVYLQPSYYEGHSLTILEAMATGLPIVSTSVGGTPEIVCHDRTGFLYAPGEYDRMAGAILDLYRQPSLCSAMGGAGCERVVKHFSIMTMVEQYENLYRRILGI